MTDKQKLMIFIHFLKKEKVYHSYVKNLKLSCWNLNESMFIATHIKNESDIVFLISYAFDFDIGKEGRVFWVLIHKKWVEICRHYKWIYF
jgi:hypothetical protein